MVVVVAASETVRLSWQVILTVDSLSPVYLTLQGFFYIPACAWVHLFVGECMCAPKRKCVCVCISRSSDVTRKTDLSLEEDQGFSLDL